jgi:hypothetical protein
MRRPAMRAAPVAGWSSPVARQAHNLKVAGSNPAPATISGLTVSAADLDGRFPGRFTANRNERRGCCEAVWFFDIVE